jgi:hypothetical protein
VDEISSFDFGCLATKQQIPTFQQHVVAATIINAPAAKAIPTIGPGPSRQLDVQPDPPARHWPSVGGESQNTVHPSEVKLSPVYPAGHDVGHGDP